MKSLVFVLTTWIVFLLMGMTMLASCTSKTTTPLPSITVGNDEPTNAPPSPTDQESETLYLPSINQKYTSQNKTLEIQETSTKQDKRIPLSKDMSLDEITGTAIEHLENELDISNDAVTLLGIESAEWNDMELGCSKPSPKYQNRALQHSLPGLRILLSVHGKTYEYHSSTEWMVFCGIAKSGLHEKILLPPTLTN